MSKHYFLDTSFLIAYAISTDNQHKKTTLFEDIIWWCPLFKFSLDFGLILI